MDYTIDHLIEYHSANVREELRLFCALEEKRREVGLQIEALNREVSEAEAMHKKAQARCAVSRLAVMSTIDLKAIESVNPEVQPVVLPLLTKPLTPGEAVRFGNC
jgi:hypothetical protein